jgi:N-ethylmaleimide reductase
MTIALFEPASLGAISLDNRVVMAPMTRSRAGDGDVPNELHVDYYSQRASAGLIITEGTQPSANGKGYCRTPGIHSEQQVAGWKVVSDAVSAAGGTMVMQLMHCGRVASHYNKDAGSETIAPSSIRAQGQMYTDAKGMVDFDVPRALEAGEIAGVIDEYRQATDNAYRAGMAGVELHCTSGYLPAQFLSTGTNHRDDKYGGSATNRIRFVVETLEAMAGVAGADRVGMRICPGNPFNDLHDENPEETFAALLDAVNSMGLAYLHVIRMPKGLVDNIALAEKHFSGPLILNDSYSFAEANAVVEAQQATAISFARHFIANPDLVARFERGAELAGFDHKTLYTPGAAGYSDYPALDDADA